MATNQETTMDFTTSGTEKRTEGALALFTKSTEEILHEASSSNLHGEIIAKIISSRMFAYSDVLVDDLADTLLSMENVFALGVVNREGKVTGFISRKELFDTLSKPFGRDLYKNKTLDYIVQHTVSYNYNRNILSVSEEISSSFHDQNIRYYLLVDDRNFFVGIFSSQDMLIYLSDMTQKDIQLAKRLQNGIVKERDVYETSRFDMIGSTHMAKGVGGDFYAVKRYDNNRWVLSLCDVSGKGVSASLVSVIIGGMADIYDFKRGVPHYIKTLNDFIRRSFSMEKFITGIFADLDDNTGEIVIYDVGHSYSFIYRKKKMIRLKSKNDVMPMGIVPDLDPRGSRFTLKPGDLLILMTDGFEEQKNPEGDEYGQKRFFRIIQKNAHRDLMDIRNNLYEDVERFRGNHPQQDDMTLIMMRYHGGE